MRPLLSMVLGVTVALASPALADEVDGGGDPADATDGLAAGAAEDHDREPVADDVSQRLIAAAVVAVPTMLAGVAAAFIFPLGLGSIFAVPVAVALPATAAAIASFFIAPWYWFWAPTLAAFGGTIVGFVVGAVVGLALLPIVGPAVGEEANLIILLPTIAVSVAVTSGLSAGAAAALVGGPVDVE